MQSTEWTSIPSMVAEEEVSGKEDKLSKPQGSDSSTMEVKESSIDSSQQSTGTADSTEESSAKELHPASSASIRIKPRPAPSMSSLTEFCLHQAERCEVAGLLKIAAIWRS